MIASHWPDAVALSLRNELAHFLIHSFLFLSAILMWIPVVSRSIARAPAAAADADGLPLLELDPPDHPGQLSHVQPCSDLSRPTVTPPWPSG